DLDTLLSAVRRRPLHAAPRDGRLPESCRARRSTRPDVGCGIGAPHRARFRGRFVETASEYAAGRCNASARKACVISLGTAGPPWMGDSSALLGFRVEG